MKVSIIVALPSAVLTPVGTAEASSFSAAEETS
jgi:hypothetical protein